MSNSWWPHGSQHTRLLSTLSPGVCPNTFPLSRWCHPNILSSAIPFSFCLQCSPSSVPHHQFPIINHPHFNESALCIRGPKYWSFSFSISTSSEFSGLISFRIDWFDLPAIQETLKSFLQHHSLKASILWCSAFFMTRVQLSPPCMTTGKSTAWLYRPLYFPYHCFSVMSDSLATPRTAAPQASLCLGFSRQEHWSRLPFPSPGDLPSPGIRSVTPVVSPALREDSLLLSYEEACTLLTSILFTRL